jgi:urease accessory protein
MESSVLRLVDLLSSDANLASKANSLATATIASMTESMMQSMTAARSLILTCDERARTRFRATLSDGTSAMVMLPRGSVVRPGSRLVAEGGELVAVVAASEQVYRVSARADSPDPIFDLLRAAYHLGNRHVPVELGPDHLKLERDPVLRDLLLRLNMTVASVFEPFDPEPGAYGGGHRHDTDVEGGATGEALSRSAHALPAPGAP